MKLSIEKPPITWVLVADAKTAQLYLPKQMEYRIPMPGKGLHRHRVAIRKRELRPILAKPLAAKSAQEYEVGRNKTGMVFESFSSARHMAEPHVNVHQEIKQHFAKHIADFLGGLPHAFDRLVLVAPPGMLGEIDARLDKHIHQKVTAKLTKELTDCTEEELTQRLGDYI